MPRASDPSLQVLATARAVQMFTNSYAVGFGDINRGLNLRSEFLDFKWRALLAEVDMSYRQRVGTSDLPFQLDRDITMCDWRSSFSDGSKMYSFPVPWPIKPAHASEFYLANTLDRAAEYTGQITDRSWVNWNFYHWANDEFAGVREYTWTKDTGKDAIETPDESRWHVTDRAWREVVDARDSCWQRASHRVLAVRDRTMPCSSGTSSSTAPASTLPNSARTTHGATWATRNIGDFLFLFVNPSLIGSG